MKKAISLLLAIVMLLGCMPLQPRANAAEGDQALYLKPNSNWLQADARFAIYYWDSNGSGWTDMADTDYDGYYEGAVPAGISNVIFCRMNPGAAANDWNNKWNQTGDLTVPTDGKNCYSVPAGSWDGANNTNWSVYTPGEDPGTPEDSDPVEVTYYVAGSAGLCGVEWANNDPVNAMTKDTDGLYKKTFEKIPAGTYEFKVTDGTWDNCWGMDGQNYVFTTTAEKNITITFNADTKEIGVILADVIVEDLYTVAGTGDLCGTEWDPANLNNKLSLQENGLYEKTFFSVPAGTHYFKVTDGTWSNSWGKDGGSDNFEFATETESNVTISFNPETKEITVTTVTVEPRYVAGSFDLCGADWNPGYAEAKMFLDTDGLYKKTFQNVPAGSYECKITAGDWGTNWGVGGLNGANYTFTTDDAYDVTIIFNPETLEISHELSEATTPALPPEPVEYDITIKVHYYRPDAAYDQWEVHMWNGVESLSSTRKFELEDVTYNGTTYGATATYYADASDTWVGFIIKKPDWTKDPDGDRKIDISNVLSGTVHVYAKSGSALNDFVTDKNEATLGAKITAAVYDSLTGILTVTTSMPIAEDPATAFTLEGPEGEMTITKVTQVGTSSDYIVEYEGEINADEIFTVYYNGAPCVVTVPNTYSTKTFESQYTYEGDDLGATWTEEATTFRLWAPTASAVSVNLYESGTQGAPDLITAYEMVEDVNGTWIVTVEGDLNGVYYDYSVTRKGETIEACDPYARTTGVNGNRAMVIDLDSTDPAGWENDNYVTQENYTDAVIWELHVRDFSIDESSGVSEANRGKFLAFTELGTTIPGTEISTGVDYMVDLGINYVHLLPVYDINSVDETTGGYNWGYDPKNYNVPEGSYSTDPYNGAVRVNEFKQMVQSLHNNGIGVIMDVVYNHVADGAGFCFNQIVPGYFSRIHDDGSYQSNSGCGNDTASERSMVRKYIVDSVLYWAEEYHIDGFRWDLVGLIDYETINAVMEAVHEVNPNIIFYGEGWEMCSWTTKDEGEYASDPYSKKMTIQPNDHLVNTEAGVFAFFNDTIRNVIHGGVFTATDKGFVCGMNADTKQTVTDGYMAYSKWGSNSARVDTPLQTINYASCHDNYTLFDNFTVDALDLKGLALSAENAAAVKDQAIGYNLMAAAYYITAQGVPFIHAGEEMLRSKPTVDAENNFVFDHNSYSSGDEVNSIKWYTLARPEVARAVEYYKGLIAFRKAHPALRMTDQAEILASMEVLETGSDNIIAILNKGGNGENNQILTIINTGDTSADAGVILPEGLWQAYVFGDRAGTEVLSTFEGGGKFSGSSGSVTILVKEGEKTEYVKWNHATTSLNGVIDLNIYVKLSQDLIEADDTFVRFTYAGKTLDVPMEDALQYPWNGDPNIYRFSCPIYAKQLADNVNVKFMKGERVIGEELNYSVKTYCENRIKDSEAASEVALCKAMLNYGAAAQQLFNYNTENLANASLSAEDKALAAVDASAYKYSITGSEEGIKAKSATLMLEDVVKVRVYFTLTGDKTIDEFTFTIDGKEVAVQQNAKGYYVETDGIVAKELEKLFSVQVGGITVNYGALSYVNSKAGSANAKDSDIAKALYAYWQAAESFLG